MGKIHFGTGGFRGIIGEDFTLENIRLLAHSLVSILYEKNLQKEVVIGYDRRKLSFEASSLIADVFSQNGIKTYLASTDSPTPAIIFETMHRNLDLGVMVTASHNPACYNGVKVFTKGGYDADVAFTELIERNVRRFKRMAFQNVTPLSPFPILILLGIIFVSLFPLGREVYQEIFILLMKTLMGRVLRY